MACGRGGGGGVSYMNWNWLISRFSRLTGGLMVPGGGWISRGPVTILLYSYTGDGIDGYWRIHDFESVESVRHILSVYWLRSMYDFRCRESVESVCHILPVCINQQAGFFGSRHLKTHHEARLRIFWSFGARDKSLKIHRIVTRLNSVGNCPLI